jgi:hypothetical protein
MVLFQIVLKVMKRQCWYSCLTYYIIVIVSYFYSNIYSIDICSLGEKLWVLIPGYYSFVIYIRVKNSSVNIGKMYLENT